MMGECREIMLRYITLYEEEGVEIGVACDICHAGRNRETLENWLRPVCHTKLTDDGSRPNLCPDHGRELGVVW